MEKTFDMGFMIHDNGFFDMRLLFAAFSQSNGLSVKTRGFFVLVSRC